MRYKKSGIQSNTKFNASYFKNPENGTLRVTVGVEQKASGALKIKTH